MNKYKVIAKREETPEENRKSEPVSTIINQKASVRHFCTLKALTVACQDRTNQTGKDRRVQQEKHGAGLGDGLIIQDPKREGNTVAFSWHLKTPAPRGQRPQLFWARASVCRPHVGGAGRVPAASVRIAAAAGPFVSRGAPPPVCPERAGAPVGDSAGPIASPLRPRSCSPARPSSQFLPRCPGQKNDLVLLFGREVRA